MKSNREKFNRDILTRQLRLRRPRDTQRCCPRLGLEVLENRVLLAGDEIPPVVTSTNFTSSGTLVANSTILEVTFSEPVAGATIVNNYQLRRAGADGLLTTSDPIYRPSVATVSGTTASLSFPALAEDTWRLTVGDSITDAAGNALDGDGNGVAGGAWSRDFVVESRLEVSVPYRWQTFNTYEHGYSGWLMGNNSDMYGGVSPAGWTDGAQGASAMSTDLGTLSTLLVNKGYATSNATIWSKVETTYQTSNGEILVVLLRLQNTTQNPINWSPVYFYSANNSRGEHASVALNGVNVWNSSSTNGLSSQYVQMTLPANSTSTVIFTSSLGPALATNAGVDERAGQFGFYANSLSLPAGLMAVDDLPSPVPFRWQSFNTYDNAANYWLMANNPSMYGGVSPSAWTDGNAVASNMPMNLSTLSTLFTQKGYAGSNAMVWSKVESTYGSSNGDIAAVMFRIQNTTLSSIPWNISFYFSSCVSLGETASVTLNGTSQWSAGSNSLGSANITLHIPGNETSTVIFVSSLGPAAYTGADFYERGGQLGFTNNSLALPTGLLAVDDFPTPVPYRWQTFNTFDNSTGNWLMSNTPDMYGGVYPSAWTDGSAIASNMSTSLSTLATMFPNKSWAGANALVWSEVESVYSSTNGEIGAALFRIQNTTASAITWNPTFYYTSNGNWGEAASVTLNGSITWYSTNGTVTSNTSLNVSVPAQSTSTFIVVSALSSAFNSGAGVYERAGQLGFTNNSLKLPAGLVAIDDLTSSAADISLTTLSGQKFVIDAGGVSAGQLLDFGNNAYDGGLRLFVDGTAYSPLNAAPTLLNGGRTVATKSQSLSQLLVSREITVPNSGTQNFARTIDVFQNASANSITVPVRITSNLGSDGATNVFATSDGDLLVEPTDTWFGTDDADGTGAPAVIHWFRAPGGIQPSSISVQEDNVEWTFQLTVPSGQTKRLGAMTLVETTRSAAIAAVNALADNDGFTGQASAYWTPTELATLDNFQFNVAPTDILLSNASLAENATAGTVIGSFSASDPNSGNTFSYAFGAGAGDTDNGSFAMNGSVLSSAIVANYEAKNSYSIRVIVTDQGGLSFEKQLVINITDVNEPPSAISLINAISTLAENSPTSSALKLADIVVSDDALGTNTLSLSATDATSFEIVGAALYLKAGVALDFETQVNYSVTINVDDTSVGLNPDASTTFALTLADLPEFQGQPVFGDGSQQRSLIQQIKVSFDGAVTIDAGAFTLLKRGSGGGVVTTTFTSSVNALGQTVATLSFAGALTRGTSGALQDGYYQLTVDGSQVHRGTQQLDANRDGVGGDVASIGTQEADNFFALYGDTNGDGVVGVEEFGQFRSSFGKSIGNVGYSSLFDFEGDGVVGISDFGQFRSRFGRPKMTF